MSLQVHGLACERGGRTLFAGLEWALGPGEVLWVQGPNGSGKSSLLRVLCGLASPAAGEVRWQGRPVHRARQEFQRELLYLGHAQALKHDLSALDNLWLGARMAGRDLTRDAAAQALATAGLGTVMHLPTGRLSQGQRQRVMLAALQGQAGPALLVLDEPFSALDPPAREGLVQALERHLARGAMLVYTTHQPVTLRARNAHTLALGAAC